MTRPGRGHEPPMPDEVVRFLTTRQALGELEPAGLGARELTEAEERRAAALRRPQDRLDHRAAHLLVRDCVQQLTGVDATSVILRQRCAECGEEGHGAPTVELAGRRTLRRVHVSLSHGGGVVAAAAAFVPVGVDVERLDRYAGRTVGLSAAESAWVDGEADPGHAFLRLWTRKEALVKVGALGLGEAARHAVLDEDGPAHRWEDSSSQEWRLREWNALPGAVGCWAVAGRVGSPTEPVVAFSSEGVRRAGTTGGRDPVKR